MTFETQKLPVNVSIPIHEVIHILLFGKLSIKLVSDEDIQKYFSGFTRVFKLLSYADITVNTTVNYNKNTNHTVIKLYYGVWNSRGQKQWPK